MTAPPVDLEWPPAPTWRAPLVAVLSCILVAEAALLVHVQFPGDPLGSLALVVVAYVFLALDLVEDCLNRRGRSLLWRRGRGGAAARCLERAAREERLGRLLRREAAGWLHEAREEMGEWTRGWGAWVSGTERCASTARGLFSRVEVPSGSLYIHRPVHFIWGDHLFYKMLI